MCVQPDGSSTDARKYVVNNCCAADGRTPLSKSFPRTFLFLLSRLAVRTTSTDLLVRHYIPAEQSIVCASQPYTSIRSHKESHVRPASFAYQ